jgi:hypothetical protein
LAPARRHGSAVRIGGLAGDGRRIEADIRGVDPAGAERALEQLLERGFIGLAQLFPVGIGERGDGAGEPAPESAARVGVVEEAGRADRARLITDVVADGATRGA